MTLDDMEFKLLLDMEKNSEHRLFCVSIYAPNLYLLKECRTRLL